MEEPWAEGTKAPRILLLRVYQSIRSFFPPFLANQVINYFFPSLLRSVVCCWSYDIEGRSISPYCSPPSTRGSKADNPLLLARELERGSSPTTLCGAKLIRRIRRLLQIFPSRRKRPFLIATGYFLQEKCDFSLFGRGRKTICGFIVSFLMRRSPFPHKI